MGKLGRKRHARPLRRGGKKRDRMRKTTLQPNDVTSAKPLLMKRLGINAVWDEKAPLTDNYRAARLVLKPNGSFGEMMEPFPLKTKEEREAAGEETFSEDDELRVLCSKPRKSGVAPPKCLIERDRKMIESLIKKHGDNLEGMVWDVKLNPMQHSIGKLKKLVASYNYWKPGARPAFCAPNKQRRHIRYYTDVLGGANDPSTC